MSKVLTYEYLVFPRVYAIGVDCDLSCESSCVPAPESMGLEAIAEGFRQIIKDDFDNISKQFYVYDALYAYCTICSINTWS